MATYDNPKGISPLLPIAGVPGITLPDDFFLEAADRGLVPGSVASKPEEKLPPLVSPVRFPLRNVEDYGDAISRLIGAYSGPGFNLIFRPHSDKNEDAKAKSKDQKPLFTIPAGGSLQPDLLELNLTHELWTFPRADLGAVPNRVASAKNDVVIRGIPYTQIVRDVTNPNNGTRVPVDSLGKSTDKGLQKLISDIHFEPGLLIQVPNSMPVSKEPTISRMASIPHGTTINAQGAKATKVDVFKPGDVKFDGRLRPDIPAFSSTASAPFELDSTGPIDAFENNQFNLQNAEATRLPQNMQPFLDSKTPVESITKKMVQDPNELIRNHNAGKIFSQVITFTVATTPTQPLDKQACPHMAARAAMNATKIAVADMDKQINDTKTSNEVKQALLQAKDAVTKAMQLCDPNEASAISTKKMDEAKKSAATAPAIGTSNIAQLDGTTGEGPNARTGKVSSTFWISTVVYTVNVKEKFQPKLDVNGNVVMDKDNKPSVSMPPLEPEEKGKLVKGTVPTFVFPADRVVEAGRYQVEATQIQYSQTVNLIFNGSGWPHISVATLVPVRPVVINFAKKLPA
ncbi:hypothetical protein FKW77_006146 [Venturia effusa]|uniref:Uncharacterized protein n=1 Tax=Venturia effusa TaxID=50376 RepID=A0A517LQB4_9PEZI|nr:hypothetical protein FKW77_006146 [Venturia effusa]